jgi:hypothetical protein
MVLIDDTNTERDTHEPLEPRDALTALVGYIHEHGPLELDGPWDLGPPHLGRLRARYGEVPGGWGALFGVVADSPWLTVEGAHVRARAEPEAVESTSARDLDRQLVAQLRHGFTPPRVFAGLCILMGLHPYWTLKAANARRGEPGLESSVPTGTGEHEIIGLMLEGLDRATSGIFEVLANLAPGHDHDVATFSDNVSSACGMGSMHIDAGLLARASRPRIPVRLGMRTWESRPHALDFVTNDLVPGFLVPARLLRKVGDQAVAVTPRGSSSHEFVGPSS